MRHFLPIAAACIAAASLLQAATEEEVCRDLSACLKQEVEVLASARDSATAAAAVAPLTEVLGKLSALNGKVDDNALWNYIDSTEGLKPELMALLRDLAREFSRLEKARFYGNGGLEKALAPQLGISVKNASAE